eukprot:scaffold9933_cov125-Isochrysis_galbana.AAC.5
MLPCDASRGRFGDSRLSMTVSFGAEAEGAARASAGRWRKPRMRHISCARAEKATSASSRSCRRARVQGLVGIGEAHLEDPGRGAHWSPSASVSPSPASVGCYPAAAV